MRLKLCGKWFLYKIGKSIMISPYTFRQLKLHLDTEPYEILGIYASEEEVNKAVALSYSNWPMIKKKEKHVPKKRNRPPTEKELAAYAKQRGRKVVRTPQHEINLRRSLRPGMKNWPEVPTEAMLARNRAHSERMKGAGNPMYGTHWTFAHRQVRRDGIFHPNYGKKHSPETRAKISAACRNLIWVTDENGKRHKRPKDFVLPEGWYYGYRSNRKIQRPLRDQSGSTGSSESGSV